MEGPPVRFLTDDLSEGADSPHGYAENVRQHLVERVRRESREGNVSKGQEGIGPELRESISEGVGGRDLVVAVGYRKQDADVPLIVRLFLGRAVVLVTAGRLVYCSALPGSPFRLGALRLGGRSCGRQARKVRVRTPRQRGEQRQARRIGPLEVVREEQDGLVCPGG